MIHKKNNYHTKMLDIISSLGNNKPKLLLHVCCGPCFTIPYEYLKDHFKITLYFNNSNIYPYEEYKRRLDELKRYCFEINADIDIVIKPYDNEKYMEDILPLKDIKEGGTRCFLCYEKRLSDVYKFAYDNNFDYVSSVMSISRYKNADKINEIGYKYQNIYPSVKWLCADFKKENGYEKSKEIILKHHMYFQHYCGCSISYDEYLKKEKNEK